MRALIVLLLLGIFSNISYAQSKTSINDNRNIFDKKGDYYFNHNEYKKAIVYYNMAYKKDANNYYSALRKAEAYSVLGFYDQAIESYRIIFETNLFIPNDYRLKYANILLKNKDIKGFETWMSKYNEIVNTEIKGYLSSTEARAKMYRDSSIVIVENENVLNTPEAEISPAVYKNKLVFASNRRNLAGNRGQDYFNIFSSQYLKDGQLGKLKHYNKNLNSKQSECSFFFSESSSSLYITRGTSKSTNLKTFVTSIPQNSKAAVEVRELTIPGFNGSIGHVSLSASGNKMYFVSDAPGGSGGLDIYTSELIAGKWNAPVNMGKVINSGKDEMFPYIVNDTVLYFTSAGHKGYGGLDLYSVNLVKENSSPKNLGSKVNSKQDDYGLSFSKEGLTGYFCSNRPGGFGKEDVYRLQLLDLKVKYAAYKHKLSTNIEKGKINLYLNNGDEHNISSEGNTGFNFSFLPNEPYKMVIQHENVLANDVINSSNLSTAQRKSKFLSPAPVHKTEIKLQTGMRYQFTAGMKPLANNYKEALNELSQEYTNTSSIDLTALAKELVLEEGEIYTIQFVKDESRHSNIKSKEETSLFIDNESIHVAGRSFFIVLPLDIEVNFNIKTDIEHFKENFNPKKVGAVKIDNAPVIKKEVVKEFQGFPILVNTESFNEVSKRKVSATELTIVPGSMYVLTLSKTNPDNGEELEIIVPLTKGVKYNLGTDALSNDEYTKAVSKMSSGSGGSDEELIDISVLSKELDMTSEEGIVFSLMPTLKLGNQASSANNVLTTLNVDGRKYFVTDRHKLQVNLKLDQTKKVSIQTDLSYVEENFEASTIKMKVDTGSFNKDIITDPVYDVVVVNFALNKYAIRPDAKTILDNKVVSELKGDKRLYVTIKGYTDGLGDASHNEKLSKDRAHSVKNYLSSNGIGENRIRTFSFGESLGLEKGVKWEDLSEVELQKHRKVEIVIYLPE